MRSRQTRRWMATLAATVLAGVAGCVSGPCDDPQVVAMGAPPDFGLVFTVQAREEGDHPLHQSSQNILEPNRTLRAAIGPGAASDYFPATTRKITPRERDDLFEHIRRTSLLSEPTSPLAASPPGEGPVPAEYYRVRITACGRTHEFATTPKESPPSAELLAMLVALRYPAPERGR